MVVVVGDWRRFLGMWVALLWIHGCVGVLFLDLWGRTCVD